MFKERLKVAALIGSTLVFLLIFGIWAYKAKGEISRTDVIITGATVSYTILTGALLWATYFASRPIITLYTERERSSVYLILANTGNKPATNVVLNFKEPIMVDGRDLKSTTGIFKHPIGSIPAGGRITTGFGFGTSLYPGDTAEEKLSEATSASSRTDDSGETKTEQPEPVPRTTLYVEGTASYEDQINGRTFRHKVIIDARYLEGLTWFTYSSDRNQERYLRDSHNELQKIRRILEPK